MSKQIEYDIEKFPPISIDILDQINEDKYCFYYDEKFNHRKFWLKESSYNAAIDEDFVLGGIVYKNHQKTIDVNQLKGKIKLQGSAKELKFKHIVGKSGGFKKDLSKNKLKIFLEWLLENDLNIHYSVINNYYYGLVDIVDSMMICTNKDENPIKNTLYPFRNEIQSILYDFSVYNKEKMFLFLKKYNYPNINIKDISNFCNKLGNMLLEYVNNKKDVFKNITLFSSILNELIKSTKNKNDLSFLNNIEKDILIENYKFFYIEPIRMFYKSEHYFDEEVLIEKELKKIKIFKGKTEINNYYFLDSKSEDLIQVSDCVVGVIGSFYKWINNISSEDVGNLDKILNEDEKYTLNMLARLIKKSQQVSIYFVSQIISMSEDLKVNKVIEWALNYKK